MGSQSDFSTGEQSSSSAAGTLIRSFISYRRSDAPSAGKQLADALSRRFGPENVFFDTKDLIAGSRWQEEIQHRILDADVVIAVIGPRWVNLADERGRRSAIEPEEDILRFEIETALRAERLLVPVLVEDAPWLISDRLPRPFRPLVRLQTSTLRQSSWDQDVESLMAELEQRSIELRAERRPKVGRAPTAQVQPSSPPRPSPPPALGLDEDHFEDIAEYLAEGSLVALLGPGANAVDRVEPWQVSSGSPPDAHELARALADRFRLSGESADLARVSQHVWTTRGSSDLHRALRALLLKVDHQPGPVHRFLARVPALLRQHGRDSRPLIISTNYDTALERAFDEVHEPFDLAVFMAAGEHKGKFFHVPWWDGGGPVGGPIAEPNRYVGFPADDEGQLWRTVIVKIHGGPLYDAPSRFQVKDNYCMTENQMFCYLSRSRVESLVPMQILTNLRESHFLFLGYGVRDWTLRVFLSRIWGEQEPGAYSWAVQDHMDKVERAFWEKLDVERIEAPLSAYVDELERQLQALMGTTEVT